MATQIAGLSRSALTARTVPTAPTGGATAGPVGAADATASLAARMSTPNRRSRETTGGRNQSPAPRRGATLAGPPTTSAALALAGTRLVIV